MQSYQRFQHIVHTVFNTSGTNGPCSLSWAKAGTHATPALSRAHSGLHAETGGVSDGGGITTLGAFRTFTNIPGPGIRTTSFAAFGAWSWVLPKNAESLRDSDALMRVAVPRRRGPAGLRDLFRFCRNRDLYIRRSWFSACARQGCYHYPRLAPHVLETLDGRLSKRFICRFLRPGSLH